MGVGVGFAPSAPPGGFSPATGAVMPMRPHCPSSVIGSFQSFRRERGRASIISLSEFGNLPYRRRKTRIPSAYCDPRKISSSSRIRCISAETDGSTAAIRIIITVSPTISATSV